MKHCAVFLCLVASLLLPSWAEPPDNAKAVRSIKEYKDTDPEADYWGALQILVDKYSLLGAYSDDTFRPGNSLTRGEAAGWLDRAAQRAEQLIEIVSDSYQGDKASFRQHSNPDAHNPQALGLFQKLKFFSSDPYYTPPFHLAEHFHLLVKGSKNTFGADEPLSEDEFSGYLKALFHFKSGPQGKQPITRAEAVDSLCDAFQFFLDEVEQRMLGK